MTEASTDTQEAPETEMVDVQGRKVEIKQLNDAQIALMARDVRLLTKAGVDGTRKMDAVARMFSVLESVVLKQEDKDYMEDLIVAGELDLKQLTSFVTVFMEDEEEAPKPKVRRGRPPVKRS